MLCLLAALGTPRKASFDVKVSYPFSVSLNSHISGFEFLFNTTDIPIPKFAKYMSLRKPSGLPVLKSLQS